MRRDGNAGALALWLMNGLQVSQAGGLGTVPVNWTIAGTDNKGDIFWREGNTGTLAIWELYGFEVVQVASLGVVPLNWVVAGTGDFDGNGNTDILWRDQQYRHGGNLAVGRLASFADRESWRGAEPLVDRYNRRLPKSLSHGVEAMANADQHPQAPPSGAPHVNPVHQSPHLSFWIRELPFSLVLILTIGGVAYTSFSKHPILIYWEILAPIIGLVCVWYGWPSVDNSSRLRLIATQLLHWIAFLLVMNMVFLASVQRVLNATSTGLAVFTLLALGTFTAGVHILSWQICLLGLIMAFGIPAIAWIENSALLLVLVLAAIVGIGVVIWWHWHERRGRTV